MDKERSVDYWANEGGKRIEFVALANGDVRINFNTSDGRTYESLTLASYRYASVVEAIGKFHKGNTMNNKELTELKKEFLEKFTHQNPVYSGLKSDATIGEVWNFFLPHLKSNDDIKREAYILGYKAGWGDDAVYKTNGELEKEAKESFDRNKSLLGLTQKETQ